MYLWREMNPTSSYSSTMLVSHVLIYLITRSLYLLNTFIQYSHPPPITSYNHKSVIFFYKFLFCFLFSILLKWDHALFIFLYLTYFTKHNVFKVHPCCHKWQDFHLSYGWITFHCIYKPHFLYPFIHWQTLDFPAGTEFTWPCSKRWCHELKPEIGSEKINPSKLPGPLLLYGGPSQTFQGW